jgi:2-oxoglutarate ferredoxin oxidoreductase subunit gamma
MVLAGVVLGEAAVLEGLEAVQSQWVFGSAARGSLARSEVVISPGEIAFPRVRRAGVLVALTQGALDRHVGLLAPGALVVIDEEHVGETGGLGAGHRISRLPILRRAAELGHERSANMLALGVVVALTGVVRPEHVEKAIGARFGARAGRVIDAFRAGAVLAGGAGS